MSVRFLSTAGNKCLYQCNKCKDILVVGLLEHPPKCQCEFKTVEDANSVYYRGEEIKKGIMGGHGE
jgi:hypothetical protein